MRCPRRTGAGRSACVEAAVAALVLAVLAPAAWCTCVSYPLESYAVFAGASLTMDDGVTVAGRVGSNGTVGAGIGTVTGAALGEDLFADEGARINGHVIFNQDVAIMDGATVSGGIDAGGVYLGTGTAVAGNVTAGGSVSGDTSGVGGTVTQGVPAGLRQTFGPVDVPARAASFGATDALTLGDGAPYLLAAGSHYYTSISAGSDVALQLDPWINGRTATAPIRIYVTGDVVFGDNLKIFVLDRNGNPMAYADALADPELAAAAASFYGETHGSMGWACGGQWLGTVYAPYGSIVFEANSDVTGALWAAEAVTLYNGTRVHPIPEPITLAGFFGGMAGLGAYARLRRGYGGQAR